MTRAFRRSALDTSNMLGRYAFTIPDMVARGGLQPLRDPSATGIDDA